MPANAGDTRDSDSITGSERYPGGEKRNPLQYSCLENPMDRGAWRATVHGVAETETTQPVNNSKFIYLFLAASVISCRTQDLLLWRARSSLWLVGFSIVVAHGLSRPEAYGTYVCIVKAVVFPVVMYGCESWTIKKAEHRRIDAFEPWCWRRLLRVPWTAKRSNQSILKEISCEYSLEGLMLQQKFQSFGHLMQRADSFEKTLMLGKIEGGRRRG